MLILHNNRKRLSMKPCHVEVYSDYRSTRRVALVVRAGVSGTGRELLRLSLDTWLCDLTTAIEIVAAVFRRDYAVYLGEVAQSFMVRPIRSDPISDDVA